VEQSPSWEAKGSSASQKSHPPPILWNPKVHYRTHKIPPPTLSWARRIQSMTSRPTSCWFILILYSHLRQVLPSGSFPRLHTITLYAPLLSHILATWPAHLILVELITPIIFCEQYWSYSSSLNFVSSIDHTAAGSILLAVLIIQLLVKFCEQYWSYSC